MESRKSRKKALDFFVALGDGTRGEVSMNQLVGDIADRLNNRQATSAPTQSPAPTVTQSDPPSDVPSSQPSSMPSDAPSLQLSSMPSDGLSNMPMRPFVDTLTCDDVYSCIAVGTTPDEPNGYWMSKQKIGNGAECAKDCILVAGVAGREAAG